MDRKQTVPSRYSVQLVLTGRENFKQFPQQQSVQFTFVPLSSLKTEIRTTLHISCFLVKLRVLLDNLIILSIRYVHLTPCNINITSDEKEFSSYGSGMLPFIKFSNLISNKTNVQIQFGKRRNIRKKNLLCASNISLYKILRYFQANKIYDLFQESMVVMYCIFRQQYKSLFNNTIFNLNIRNIATN